MDDKQNNNQLKPIAKVINNNQPGWTNIIETEPNVTLEVGLELYTKEQVNQLIAENTKLKEEGAAQKKLLEKYIAALNTIFHLIRTLE